MKEIILIFIGGGLGSLTRFAVSKGINSFFTNFPLGTFSSNLLASFLLGLFIGALPDKNHPTITPFFVIGFCGGFSTFSTFSYDNFLLIKSNEFTSLLLNIFMNLVLCLVAVLGGIKAGLMLKN